MEAESEGGKKDSRGESEGQGISKILCSMVYGIWKPEFWFIRYLVYYILFYYETVELNVLDSFKS